MHKNNEKIKKCIKEEGLKQWQVAECYGLSEGNFSRLLRKSFSEEIELKILKSIEKAKKEYL
ncbi:hypothetical protein [Bacillus sp. SRB_28]|uniref:hypothetical protein n=1 Tax=Bacillus manliponensis TaxID=574376 RepID=UPI000DC50B33|nr:hypothetical protein B5P41_04595 [Bacillus sp. SRB_28]